MDDLRAYVLALAYALDATERTGAAADDPEGSRVITMSDTLARQIAGRLRELAGK